MYHRLTIMMMAADHLAAGDEAWFTQSLLLSGWLLIDTD